MATIIPPTDIYVETISENFWWAAYGLEPAYEEDIFIHYNDRKGNKQSHSTEIITKGHIRFLHESGAASRVMLQEECDAFKMTLEELLSARKILYSSDPGAIFHPADEIGVSVVKEAVARYCRDFYNVRFSNVHLLRKPRRAYMVKTFAKEQGCRKDDEERKRRGITTRRIFMTPEFLEDMFGSDEVSGIGGEIDYGFMDGKNYFVRLKNGSVQPIGPRNLTAVE